jgi:alpha/beta superfamily hydrolase
MKWPTLLVALLAASSVFAQNAGPSMDELAIPSHGSRLNGLVYQAAGAGPHPVVVFFHGYPGNEKNLDLAQAVRRAGFDAVYFDYRGTWGSGGTFSFGHGLEDAATVLAWVRANAAKYHFDTKHIAIVGHSFGGWVALLTAPHEPHVCVAAMAAWNIGWEGQRFAKHPDERKGNLDYFQYTTAAGGPVHAAAVDLANEMAAHAEWDYLSLARPLADHPLLLIAATHDSPDEDPAMHERLASAVRAAGGKRVTVVKYDDDHPFSAHRIELANVLTRWLQTTCVGAGS